MCFSKQSNILGKIGTSDESTGGKKLNIPGSVAMQQRETHDKHNLICSFPYDFEIFEGKD